MSWTNEQKIELLKFVVQKTKDRIADPKTAEVPYAKEMEEARLRGYLDGLRELGIDPDSL